MFSQIWAWHDQENRQLVPASKSISARGGLLIPFQACGENCGPIFAFYIQGSDKTHPLSPANQSKNDGISSHVRQPRRGAFQIAQSGPVANRTAAIAGKSVGLVPPAPAMREVRLPSLDARRVRSRQRRLGRRRGGGARSAFYRKRPPR